MIRLTHNKYISEMFPTLRGPAMTCLVGIVCFLKIVFLVQ